MIFFFYGPNSYASRRKLHDMADAYVKKTGSDLGLERIDGEGTSYTELVSALSAMPFLATSRLVIVEGLGLNKVVAEKIEDLIGLVPESTVAVFYETDVDQRTSYFKKLQAGTKAVKFDNLDQLKLAAWIKAEVNRHGGSIEPGAVSLLIDIVGDDQWRLSQEILKLVNYDAAITTASVRELVVATPQQTIFDLVDAMTAGKVKPALASLRGLLAERTNEIYILTMIIWQLRNLLLAKAAGRMSPPELAKAAGMSPYVAGKMMTKQRDFNEETLRQAFLAAVETDYAIKTGQGAADQLIEQLVYRVAQLV